MTPADPVPPGPPAGDAPPKRRTWLTCLLIAIGVVLLAIGAVWGFVMFVYHDY